MFNLRTLFKTHTEHTRSYAELIPWMVLVAPDIVLNTDGTLMMVFEYQGVDAEGKMRIDIDDSVNRLERSFTEFDERFMVWSYVDRRKSYFYPESSFSNSTSALIDEHWRKKMTTGDQMTNRHVICILMKQATGSFSFFDIISKLTSQGYSPLSAIKESLKISLFKDNNALFQDSLLQPSIREFQIRANAFEDALGFLKPKRLASEDLLQFMFDRLNPVNEGQKVSFPAIPAYLNTYLPSNHLIRDGSDLRFDNGSSRFVKILTVKGWPGASEPGIMDGLLSAPVEITLVNSFLFVSNAAAEKHIDSVYKHFLQSSKKILGYLKEAVTNEESSNVNRGKLMKAEDAASALEELTGLDRSFGYLSYTVMVYADSKVELTKNVAQVNKMLGRAGYITIEEDQTKIVTCFAATLAGQWASQLRWWFMSAGNFADLLAIRTISTGPQFNKRISELNSAPQPMHALFPTDFDTPFYFNFHATDLAHAFVVGPSRKGKTVLMMFLLSQFFKYPKSNAIVFDKDFSTRVTVHLHGGTYIDASVGSDTPVFLNPCRGIDQDHNQSWLIGFVELLLESRGNQLSTAESAEIVHAIRTLSSFDSSMWRLSNVRSLLASEELRTRLDPWIGDGRYARYFDNTQDTFDLSSSLTAIEIGKLLNDPILATAFLEYVFHRITQNLDGRPTFIYVEECWFMLDNPRFASRLDDWLRTFAKKDAFLVLTTQSLDELSRSKIFSTIIDNVPTRIYLPNPNALAHADMYRSKFGLNDSQINRIRTAEEKRDYYFTTADKSRMVTVSFPNEILSALRSDSIAQAAFKKTYQKDNPDWIHDYFKEMENA